MITVPDNIHGMIWEVSDYLNAQGFDDIRIEITASGVYIQRKDAIRCRKDRRFQQ